MWALEVGELEEERRERDVENYGELTEKWANDWTKPKLYTWLPGDYLIMYEKIKI